MPTVSAAEIEDLLRALARTEWPASKQDAVALGTARGWTLTLETRRGVRFTTGLGTNDDRANALIDPDAPPVGSVVDLTVHVSDRTPDDAGAVDAAFAEIRTAVEHELGVPTGFDRWENPRAVWDLSTGGRIVVQHLGDIVVLVLLSRDSADLERDEARLGIDPNRVPGTGQEDL